MRRLNQYLSAAVFFYSTVGLLAAQGVYFVVEPPAGGTQVELYALSHDGTVAVGQYSLPGVGMRPMRWTSAGGSVDIGGTVNNAVTATCCSGDGSVILGFGGIGPWRWTVESGIVPLPPAPGTTICPYAVSEDGLAVTGSSIDTAARSFRWTEMVGYQNIPASGQNPLALDMSADGSTIIGAFLDDAGTEMFLWRAGQGTAAIPLTGEYSPNAMGISYDGRFVVGAAGGTAARYDAQSGDVTLFRYSDGVPLSGRGVAVSADGNRAVCRAPGGLSSSYLWDSVHGARSLFHALQVEYGIEVGFVGNVIGMSADGAVIAGSDWVVNLSQPQPYTGRPPCQGDIDGNGRIGLSDLARVLGEWRVAEPNPEVDLTGDGIVDQLDLNIVLIDFGMNCSGVQSQGSSGATSASPLRS